MRCWLLLVALGAAPFELRAGDTAPAFFRGLNLNGPTVTIDGHAWEGADSKNYECQDKAFENQAVPLVPPTDPERAKMIRSSRWGGSENSVKLINVPPGQYSVFLYVWEDNDPERISIALNGKEVVNRYNSRGAGHWDKLGPWLVEVKEREIRLTS